MLDTATLAFESEQMIPLDEAALSAISGGLGPGGWLLKKIGDTLADCLLGSIDEIIAGAREGYGS